MASLLDDVGPDARQLLDILMEAWARTDQWPIRQYVAHHMARADLDLSDVLRGLPEWNHGYRAVRVLRWSNPLPSPLAEVDHRQVRLMLAGEPTTWLGVSPDPDSPDWTWDLWFRPLGPFAVDTGLAYLAALEELIGGRPEPPASGAPVEPSALPRALDHLDAVWYLLARQRLFKRPGFSRAASLAEAAASAAEFEARCNALYDLFSMLTVPKVDKAEGPLNFLRQDLKQRISDPDSLERATDAVATLQQVVKLRRGQAHSDAA